MRSSFQLTFIIDVCLIVFLSSTAWIALRISIVFTERRSIFEPTVTHSNRSSLSIHQTGLRNHPGLLSKLLIRQWTPNLVSNKWVVTVSLKSWAYLQQNRPFISYCIPWIGYWWPLNNLFSYRVSLKLIAKRSTRLFTLDIYSKNVGYEVLRKNFFLWQMIILDKKIVITTRSHNS